MDDLLDVQPSTARCPACATLMSRLVTSEGVVAGCPSCGGIWIDHVMANLILAGSCTDLVRSFCSGIAAKASGARAGYRDAPSPGGRLCPVCGTDLVATTFGARRLEIDTCARDGTFFDVRELDVIAVDAATKAAADDRDAAELGDTLARGRRAALIRAIFSPTHFG